MLHPGGLLFADCWLSGGGAQGSVKTTTLLSYAGTGQHPLPQKSWAAAKAATQTAKITLHGQFASLKQL
jgi:hypothetical protein